MRFKSKKSAPFRDGDIRYINRFIWFRELPWEDDQDRWEWRVLCYASVKQIYREFYGEHDGGYWEDWAWQAPERDM